jgi:hypothetical protein
MTLSSDLYKRQTSQRAGLIQPVLGRGNGVRNQAD